MDWLGYLILILPVDIPNSVVEFPPIQSALYQACLNLEIVNAKEKEIYSVSEMRRRYQECRDYPSIDDTLRFPSYEQCQFTLAQNNVFQEYVNTRAALEKHRHEDWFIVREEVNSSWATWDLLRDATNEDYYICTRRQALNNLRLSLGEQSYGGGVMPSGVPLWAYERR